MYIEMFRYKKPRTFNMEYKIESRTSLKDQDRLDTKLEAVSCKVSRKKAFGILYTLDAFSTHQQLHRGRHQPTLWSDSRPHTRIELSRLVCRHRRRFSPSGVVVPDPFLQRQKSFWAL